MTATTRKAVWIGLLNADRQVRYYGELSDRYSKWSRGILIALAVSGSVEATLVFKEAWSPLIILFAVAVAAFSIWAAVSDYAKKAAILSSINRDCSYLETQWQDLWGRIDRIDEDLALQESRKLEQRLIDATKRAADVGVHEDQELNKKSWVNACKVVSQNYA